MYLKSISAIALAAVLTSCGGGEATTEESEAETTNNSEQVMTYPSGLQIEMITEGTGEKVENGDKVSVHYVGTLEDGSKFDSSRDRNQPFEFQVGAGQVIKGWDEGLAQLKVGDKAKLTIPADLGYGATARPSIPANSTLIFEVEVMDKKAAPKPIVMEPFSIDGIEPIKTESGLEVYVIEANAEGTAPTAGQNVAVHYAGFLENGNKFDSSFDRGEPIEFPVGTGRVIPGWDEGIMLLKTGEKARMIIPSELAYGDREVGGGLIPANSTLIFDVQLVSVQ